MKGQVRKILIKSDAYAVRARNNIMRSVVCVTLECGHSAIRLSARVRDWTICLRCDAPLHERRDIRGQMEFEMARDIERDLQQRSH